MKAIGYTQCLPITQTQSLIDIEVPKPEVSGHDLLVHIKAIAVNPVDYKIRQNVAPESGQSKVIGWDAVGEVVATGEKVEHFAVGDEVFYAGDLTRPGCNAEYQCVDERIVGHKPSNLSHAEAAAIPLTAITAWELLFEHLDIQQTTVECSEKSNEIVLITGAAGGVGSILIQLARVLTRATIIATASRPSSKQWVGELGADYVIDHSQPLEPQIALLNIGQVTHIASLNASASYMDSYVDLIAPFGKIGVIDDPGSWDISKLKLKSLSLHWEFMFARSMFHAKDMHEQGNLLNRVSELLDQGILKSTIGKNLGTINAQNLKAAHKELESGTSIGKIVLEGF